jgi:hypothetical protein
MRLRFRAGSVATRKEQTCIGVGSRLNWRKLSALGGEFGHERVGASSGLPQDEPRGIGQAS